jgi:hypothetical protein
MHSKRATRSRRKTAQSHDTQCIDRLANWFTNRDATPVAVFAGESAQARREGVLAGASGTQIRLLSSTDASGTSSNAMLSDNMP